MDKGKDACDYNPKNIVEFLVDKRQLSLTHLCNIRSSISSVFVVIHEEKGSIN